jgi:YVTN family beta-propeller protein
MLRRTHTQPSLLERYWSQLRRSAAAQPPAGLDATTAQVASRLARSMSHIEARPAFADELERRLYARIAANAPDLRDWSRPSVNTHRPAAPTTSVAEREEQHIMSDITRAHSEPIQPQERRWYRETLKIVAAAIVFGIIGALLALALRDNTNEELPIVPGATTPTIRTTPTATSSPTAGSSPTTVASTAAEAARASMTAIAALQGTGATAAAASATAEIANLPMPVTVAATIAVGGEPVRSAAGAGSIWVPNARDGTVSRIDPATNQVIATVSIGPTGGPDGSPTLVAARKDEIWALNNADGSLVRIDPTTNQAVQTIPISDDGTALDLQTLLVGTDALWLTQADNTIARIDPATGTIVATIPLDNSPALMAALTSTDVWVQTRSTVYRIDLAANAIVASVSIPDGLFGLAATDDAVWTSGWATGKIYRIDPATNQIVATIQAPINHLPHFALTDDAVWVGSNNHVLGELGLLRIDPATNEVMGGLALDGDVIGMLASDGSIWASVVFETDPGIVVRVNAKP